MVLSLYFIFFLGCRSGIQYNSFPAIDTKVEKINNSLNGYRLSYKDIIAPYLHDAILKGFLHNSPNRQRYNLEANNNLEEGLGYIFFNTLRAKMSVAGLRLYKNLNLWQGRDNDQGYRCPRPWKYMNREIGGVNYGVFYLDCVQMGEYYKIDSNNPIRNYDYINNEGKNYAKAPYMKVYYNTHTNGNDIEERSSSFKLHIDHLMKDNLYLIELPDKLHQLKTKHLDPFILLREEINRISVSVNNYWKTREDYISAMDNDFSNCRCGNQFEPPTNQLIANHQHNHDWKNNWIAKMNRSNVVTLIA
ncbi:hypothetical protein ACRRVB_04820 [Candidatus Cardinium hertigii]